MKEIWEYLKGFFIVLGLMITLLIFIAAFDYKSPEWSGNIIDDLLYYAYNSEKFGLIAYLWRFFIVYAVLVTAWQLARKVWQILTKKFGHLFPLKTNEQNIEGPKT
jgi:ABC-type multidrug transport system fused ATPase/permease subunit